MSEGSRLLIGNQDRALHVTFCPDCPIIGVGRIEIHAMEGKIRWHMFDLGIGA